MNIFSVLLIDRTIEPIVYPGKTSKQSRKFLCNRSWEML